MNNKELLIIETEKLNPATLFTETGIEPILAQIRAEVAKFKPDMTTAVGRKEIITMASKVGKSKTYLDGLGKTLKADWKAKCDKVDAARKKVRDQLDILKEEVRKPVTEWESDEKTRLQKHQDNLALLESLAATPLTVTATDIRERMARVSKAEQLLWEEYQEKATQVMATIMAHLEGVLEQTLKREAEQAELKKLQVEKEERERADKEKAIAEEAVKKVKLEAAEKVKAEQEAAAEERREAIAREEAAKLEAKQAQERERIAVENAERERVAAKEREILAVAKAKKDAEFAAMTAAQDEKDRIAAGNAKIAAEKKRLEEDKENRQCINLDVMTDLQRVAGLTTEAAGQVLKCLQDGAIRHASIDYFVSATYSPEEAEELEKDAIQHSF